MPPTWVDQYVNYSLWGMRVRLGQMGSTQSYEMVLLVSSGDFGLHNLDCVGKFD